AVGLRLSLHGALPIFFARLEEPPGLLPSLVLQTVAAAEGTTPAVEWNHHTSTLSGARLRGADGRVLRVPLAEDEPYTLIDYPGRSEEHTSELQSRENL